jgi:hypothetical protein
MFGSLIASIGLTVGLALQGSLSNIAGGIMVVGLKPFEVGDYIESNGVGGTVTDIAIFYTTLTTPDNKKIVVPNGALSNSVVVNYSANDTRRLDLTFSISYNTDLDLAKKVLLSCAKLDERIFSDPAPVVYITEHADSAVMIQLRVWLRKENYWDVNFAMIEQVKRSFDQLGVENRVQTAIAMHEVAEPYIRNRATNHLKKGRVVIFGCGTGNPFCSTDTAAALRAAEIEADVIFKASMVDGIYDSDPHKNPDAVKYDHLTYMDVLTKNLQVMDSTAATLCRDNGISLLVFNLEDPENIVRAVRGETIGTVVD